MNQKLTRRDLAKAWILYEDGKNIKEVAKIIGVSDRTIQPWLKKLGITRKDRIPPHKHKARRINQIIKMYRDGMPVMGIAEHLNIPHLSVRWILKKYGMLEPKTALQVTRRRGSLFTDKDTVKTILHRYCVEGLSQPQIAKRFGVSHGCIQGFIRRQRDRINSCLKQGQTLDAIAIELGIPAEAIYKLIGKKYDG